MTKPDITQLSIDPEEDYLGSIFERIAWLEHDESVLIGSIATVLKCEPQGRVEVLAELVVDALTEMMNGWKLGVGDVTRLLEDELVRREEQS